MSQERLKAFVRRAGRGVSGKPFGDTEGSICKGSKVKRASRAQRREDMAERVEEMALEKHPGCCSVRASWP